MFIFVIYVEVPQNRTSTTLHTNCTTLSVDIYVTVKNEPLSQDLDTTSIPSEEMQSTSNSCKFYNYINIVIVTSVTFVY